MIKVAIVDDDEGIRKNLKELINNTPGFTCVADYSSAEDAISSLKPGMAEVLLMDINLPKQDGIFCTALLKEKMPELLIIMLTVYEDTERIWDSLKAGACGYLLKRTDPTNIIEAIHDTVKGGSAMSSQVARKVIHYFSNGLEKKNAHIDSLSNREKDVLAYLSKGYRYQEIADTLFINVETVRSHLRNIYEKLQVRSRTEAVLKYLGKS